MIGVAHNRG